MQRTSSKYSASPFSRYYKDNAVLQLIVALGSAFVIFHFTLTVMRIMEYPEIEILQNITDNTTLPALPEFKYKIWTLFTYGLFHIKQAGVFTDLGFWSMFSNMVWLYCFGSLLQMMIGFRHVMPLFFYSVIVGGIFYMLAQYVPAWAVAPGQHLGGAQAGIVALAAASVTIAPNYRFYLAPHFSVPMMVVVAIFGVLMMMYTGVAGAQLMLISGGALMGFIYITLLRGGSDISRWLYSVTGKIGGSFTPKEDAYKKHSHKRSDVLNSVQKKQVAEEQRVDEILDKINKKGYNSLTKEEKDILLRASKEN